RSASVEQEGEARDRAQVDVHQHPVAKRARAPQIDLFAQRVAHHGGDADEADEARYPANRQPRVSEARVYAEAFAAPDRAARDGDVGALGRAVAAGYAGLRVNVYLRVLEAADGPRGAARQSLRVLAVHGDRGDENLLA